MGTIDASTPQWTTTCHLRAAVAVGLLALRKRYVPSPSVAVDCLAKWVIFRFAYNIYTHSPWSALGLFITHKWMKVSVQILNSILRVNSIFHYKIFVNVLQSTHQ